ncbi:hypothetical protein [Rhodococcoides yunnanense]|uniref:hypothetical protein n=1 Tax=Rhodococcoides yunnanense TaxID=278209 RepID=UPI001473C12B|nr:hypothetical protein [Rhodococcus yunnanensis]
MSTHPEHHDHCWTTSSRHETSEGTVVYHRCTCGAQRIVSTALAVRGLVALVDR